MAHWRSIGGTSTIAPGATAYWEYSYPPNGRDIGVAVAAPNAHEGQINVEYLVVGQGIVQRQSTIDEGGTAIHYTVRIKNLGPIGFRYNLNIGDWQ